MKFKFFKRIFRIKEDDEKEFSEMNKNEKKQFLSNDFIDRMIKVEQRVSYSFGEHTPYYQTMYYKSLTGNEKKAYKRYLKKIESQHRFLLSLFFLSFLLFFFLRIEFTGNATREIIGNENTGIFSVILVIFILVSLFLLLILFIFKKTRKKRIEKYFDVLDRIGLKAYIRR